MGDTNKNLNKEILSNFSGQQQILTIPKLYIKITGSHEKSLALNQIIFFSNKSELADGWFYKSYEEWFDEILIPERTLRRIFTALQKQSLIITKTNKVRGKRVLLIKPNFEQIYLLIDQYLSQPAILSGDVDNSSKIDHELPQPDKMAGIKIAPTGQNGRLQPDKMAVSIYTDDYLTDDKNKYICAFDFFWEKYPIKKSKQESKKIWSKKNLDIHVDVILEAIDNQKENDNSWLTGYIPNPTKYLNEERWMDEIRLSPEKIKKMADDREREKQIIKTQQYIQEKKIMKDIEVKVGKGLGYATFRNQNNLPLKDN